MEKKNIPLSAISVDVEIQPDNTLVPTFPQKEVAEHIIRTYLLRL